MTPIDSLTRIRILYDDFINIHFTVVQMLNESLPSPPFYTRMYMFLFHKHPLPIVTTYIYPQYSTRMLRKLKNHTKF